MRTLFFSAGKRISYENPVEERIKLSVYCVVQESVAHGSLVYVSGLRIGYFKGHV